MKIDLHVHSKHSKKPNDWILRKIGTQESYTDPMDVYRIAKNRGMNTVFFHPSKRSSYWSEKWGVPPDSIKGLFVGRISREKDVPLLVRVIKAITDERRENTGPVSIPQITILAVGAGAYENKMKRECKGYPVVLTGKLNGEELVVAFASADFFAFPSTTDTFGRVVLEALASGLPLHR